MRTLPLIVWILLCSLLPQSALAAGAEPLTWLRDDRAAFDQARAEQRFVLLYLEAVWCHWCHVMDRDTYGDRKVRELVDAHYVPLKIDQDLRPDLANRYRNYGWPATIVFAADGTEIVKRRGFVPPQRFARLLQAIVDDPSPEHVTAVDSDVDGATLSALTEAVRTELLKRHRETFDPVLGGLRSSQKSMDRDQVEYALWRAGQGDADEARIARTSLDGALHLIDPAWGGVYQYSTDGDWDHPHFEKLARVQGEYLKIYALACAHFDDARYCDGARAIARYIRDFLTAPDGSFYTAQDADLTAGEHAGDYFRLGDRERRARGTPRVDTHIYARENGFIIEGLATLYEATGDIDALAAARKAAERMLALRTLDGGGFRHDERDTAGPYLADTLAMGRGLLALYRVTGERSWMTPASASASFIGLHFKAPGGGFLTAVQGDAPIAALPHLDEVIWTTRFLNLLARYNGEAAHQALARHGMRYLARPEIALSRMTDAGILLADAEIAGEPLHLTIRGARDEPAARSLFIAALRIPAAYKRLDWWDDADGPLPNPDITYPNLSRSAAYFCTERTCSVPLTRPEQLAEFLRQSRRADDP